MRSKFNTNWLSMHVANQNKSRKFNKKLLRNEIVSSERKRPASCDFIHEWNPRNQRKCFEIKKSSENVNRCKIEAAAKAMTTFVFYEWNFLFSMSLKFSHINEREWKQQRSTFTVSDLASSSTKWKFNFIGDTLLTLKMTLGECLLLSQFCAASRCRRRRNINR